VEHQLTEIWQQVLGIESISIKDNFFDLGGHSLLAIKLFWYIEQKFGQKLPLSILFQSGTIETIAEIISPSPKLDIKDTSSSSLGSSLVKIQPRGSRPPFFCIHGLGGEVLCFRNLAVHLGLDQPFYGIQPVGLEGKTSPYTRVEDMADHYIREMRTVQSQGPYFLGGYSFGGIVAFEAAKQLLQQGEEIGKLIVFDTCLPGYEWRSPLWKRIFLHLENILTQGPTYLQQKIKGWSKQVKYQNQYQHQNQSRYRRYLEEASNLSPTDKHLEIIGINDQAAREYTLKPYPGQIILMRTEDKHRDNSIGQEYVSHFGWADLAQGGLEIHFVPGSHVSLFDDPHVEIMAAKLRDCLQM
jgi:thioesterase domain-containing protein/acyl carrier protein